jgi:hypothetical protein
MHTKWPRKPNGYDKGQVRRGTRDTVRVQGTIGGSRTTKKTESGKGRSPHDNMVARGQVLQERETHVLAVWWRQMSWKDLSTVTPQ